MQCLFDKEIMKEDFVTYDLAIKLKEKGFKEYCEHGYFLENGRDVLYTPTISQVLKWLREEKKIHIIIPASFDEGYWWESRDFSRGISEYADDEYNTYEQAALAGIGYVIDNLI